MDLFKVSKKTTICQIYAKVNNNDISQNNIWCLYCELRTLVGLCSTVLLVEFEQIAS